MSNGACVSIHDIGRQTPIHSAAKNGHKDVVGLLIKYGGDLNTVSENGFTSLHLAVQNRYADIVELLIIIGANLEARNIDG